MTYINLLQPNTFNVKQFGALGDGITDDTSAIASAITAATSSGGIVYFPPGTYISTTQTLVTGVILQGAGVGTTTLKLKAATNADLLNGGSTNVGYINLAGAANSGNTGGIYNFAIRDMTLDGNKANQSSGPCYPLRFYGYSYLLANLIIQNGYSGGVLCDWNGGSETSIADKDAFAAWNNVRVWGSGGIGIQIGGPHDSNWQQVHSYLHASHSIHICPNANALQATACHGWGPNNGNGGTGYITWLVETGSCSFVNCNAEGSNVCQLVLLNNDNTWVGGRIFGNSPDSLSSTGIQIGQGSGNTPYPGQIYQSAGVTTSQSVAGLNIDTKILLCQGTNGAIWFANDGGHHIIRASIYQTAGSVYTGTWPETSQVLINANGLTADGTSAKGGFSNIGVNSQSALLVTDMSQDIFVVDTYDKRVQLINGTSLRMYSDNYSTTTLQLAGGTINFAQSSSAAAIANSGTITTSGVGIARVAPTGNVTGIILQAGTTTGQMVTVVNESAFTLTLNTTPATSNVADSATEAVIAANTARIYIWDSSTSRWYNVRGA